MWSCPSRWMREGGVWRIHGSAGETPRVLPFGTAPHPLF